MIVAGGPSLRDFDWTSLDGHDLIAINNAAFRLPQAQIVYFTDTDWMLRWEAELKAHAGVKHKGSLPDELIRSDWYWTREWRLTNEFGIETKPHCLSHGRNSGYAAINLAVQLGYKDIYLLGYDMHNVGTTTNFHTDHTRTTPDTAYHDFLDRFNTMVEPLKAMSVNVWNSTPGSSLKAFPEKPLPL